MAKRIYSNYSDGDFEDVVNFAAAMGFSPSAFQRYCTMLSVRAPQQGDVVPLDFLIKKIDFALSTKKSGDTFIVSSLLPEDWPNLSRSEKMTLAKYLSRFVSRNSNRFKVCAIVNGSVNKYETL